MMRDRRRYPFVSADSALGEASFRPYLPIILSFKQQTLETVGLLDTGAAVNVLPYRAGLALGAVWREQDIVLHLTGNLAKNEARLLLADIAIAPFPLVRMAFAWTKTEGIPLILGQVNFFMEFDVCFYRSELAFEVSPCPKASAESR